MGTNTKEPTQSQIARALRNARYKRRAMKKDLLHGTVQKYDPVSGYGFIRADEGQGDGRFGDYFFHVRRVVRGVALEPGEKVDFQVEISSIGLRQAVQVFLKSKRMQLPDDAPDWQKARETDGHYSYSDDRD